MGIETIIASAIALISIIVNIILFLKNRKDKKIDIDYNYREKNIELRETIIELNKKITSFDDIKKIEDDLVYLKSTYYRKGDNGNESKYYCTNCWDNNKKLITVRFIEYPTCRTAYCGVCKSSVDFD